MKTKLLLLALFFCFTCFSQTMNSFTSDPGTNFIIMNATTVIDQTPTGANATWTFNNLTPTGTNIDTYAAPSAGQLTTYPGTTEVLSITTQGGTPTANDLFLKEDGGGNSITGASSGDIILNYSGTNAFIGLFPMTFGTTNSNTVSGTFSYLGTNGTFTGTVTSSVDAYGVLNINNIMGGSYSGNVTRLRVDQTLSFSIPPIFNNIGTLTQTSYYYYDNSINNIAFRYNNAILVSGFLGINENTETFESNVLNTLSSNTFENKTLIKLYPNPTETFLNLKIESNNTLESINITDNQGRVIFTSKKNINQINVKDLNSGLYFVTITTASGERLVEKFIKKK